MTKDSTKNPAKKVSKLSFEEAATRLEEIVETLSSEKVDLNSMIELYEEGNALREHCQKMLDEAKMKIEIVGKKSDAKSS